MSNWKLLLILVPIVFVIDMLWLGVVMKSFYAREIGELMRRNGEFLTPRWSAAFLVYLLIPAGIVLFVRPLLGESSTVWQAFGWGALFGLIVYGVYDLTNLAVLEKWTLLVTLVDMVWGGVLCGTTTVIMQGIAFWWNSAR